MKTDHKRRTIAVTIAVPCENDAVRGSLVLTVHTQDPALAAVYAMREHDELRGIRTVHATVAVVEDGRSSAYVVTATRSTDRASYGQWTYAAERSVNRAVAP